MTAAPFRHACACAADHGSGCGASFGLAGQRPSPAPGLDALSLRLGRHDSFLRAMIPRLAGSAHPNLAELRTRDPGDPLLALLDAGATLMDVLTFYGERLLNEGYLGTATEALSVEALARLVGYAPRPGVAASVHLAYLLEAGHADVPIPVGTRSQSVPAPGELPQTFETSDDLIAQAPLSILHARLTRPPLVLSDEIESRDYFVQGLGTGLRVGDTLLFTFGTGAQAPRALMDIHTVELDAPHSRTRVGLAFHGSSPQHAARPATTVVSALRQLLTSEHLTELNLDADMPSVQRLSGLVQRFAEQPGNAGLTLLRQQLEQEGQTASRQGWRNVGALIRELTNALGDRPGGAGPAPASAVKGTSTVTRILGELRRPPSVQPASALLLRRSVQALIGGATDSAPRLYAALYPQLRPQLYAALATAQVAPEAPLTNVDALRVRAGLFGAAIPRSTIPPRHPVDLRHAWSDLLGLTVNADNEVTVPPEFNRPVGVLALNGEYAQIRVGSWLAVERPSKPGLASREGRIRTFHEVQDVETLSVAADSLAYTARVTVLTLVTPWLEFHDDVEQWLGDTRLLRETAVYAAPEPLELAPEVLQSPVGGDDEIELDGLYRGLNTGRFVLVEGARDDLQVTQLRDAELGMVAAVEHRLARTPDGADWPSDTLHTFIRLAAPLQYRFRRDTLALYGNVVRATHGETRTEVLGDGDSRMTNQTFALKQGPLTYLPAVTPRGAQATLTVRVNGLRWHEVLRPGSGGARQYTLDTDAAGQSTVRFGGRLPTGRENLTATYRSGLGRAGNVAAGQITLLMSKPLGVKGVVNPLRADGGADREGRDQIRRNAPTVTMALDRLVSVRDYEDFARTFAGIGKASARRFAGAGRPLVHLTVAGAADAPLSPGSDLARALRTALRRSGDPGQALRLETRTLRLLVVQADVMVDPDWTWTDVEARVRARVLARFSFGARELAQGAAQSEVLTVMQEIPGVRAVRLVAFDAIGDAELQLATRPPLALRGVVPARPAQLDADGTLRPAQLLILTPDVPDTLVLNPWSVTP